MFWVGYLSSHQKFLQLPEFESFQKLLQVIPTNDEKFEIPGENVIEI